MTKLLFVLLMLFSLSSYALSEAECQDRAVFIAKVGFHYRDAGISHKEAKEDVFKLLTVGGFPENIIKEQALPLVDWVYSKKLKDTPTEVFAQAWYETCLKVNNGDRLPRKDKAGWQDRADLQRGGDTPSKEAG